MNSLTFVGNLGKDPQVKTLDSGKSVTNFSVAMSSGWGQNEKTTWVECSLWGKKDGSAHGLSDYLKKGSRVTIIGEVHLREWESNGKNGASLECNVNQIDLAKGADVAPSKAEPLPDNDDIPF